jgi:hypothetical protein
MPESSLDPLFRVNGSNLLNSRTKKSIATKMKNVVYCVRKVEEASGLKYPPYYVEPVLMVIPPSGNLIEGLGVLYARTIPVEIGTTVRILVELSAPLVLYATRSTLQLIFAHEFLHYVQLVKKFTTMNIVSQITSSTMFEDKFVDSERAVDPSLLFGDKKLVRELKKEASHGSFNEKLNEKCRTKWIDKNMPMSRLSVGYNQVNVSVEAIMRTEFDSKIKQIATTLP